MEHVGEVVETIEVRRNLANASDEERFSLALTAFSQVHNTMHEGRIPEEQAAHIICLGMLGIRRYQVFLRTVKGRETRRRKRRPHGACPSCMVRAKCSSQKLLQRERRVSGWAWPPMKILLVVLWCACASPGWKIGLGWSSDLQRVCSYTMSGPLRQFKRMDILFGKSWFQTRLEGHSPYLLTVNLYLGLSRFTSQTTFAPPKLHVVKI